MSKKPWIAIKPVEVGEELHYECDTLVVENVFRVVHEMDDEQHLTVIEKHPDGKITKTRVLPVRFSPFQGGNRI